MLPLVTRQLNKYDSIVYSFNIFPLSSLRRCFSVGNDFTIDCSWNILLISQMCMNKSSGVQHNDFLASLYSVEIGLFCNIQISFTARGTTYYTDAPRIKIFFFVCLYACTAGALKSTLV